MPATVHAGKAAPYPIPAIRVPGRIDAAHEASDVRDTPSTASPTTNCAMPPRVTGLVPILAIRNGPSQALDSVKAVAIGNSPHPVCVAEKPRISCIYSDTTTKVGPRAVLASSETRLAPPVTRRQKIGMGTNGDSTMLSTQTNKASRPMARASNANVVGEDRPTCSLLAKAKTSIAAPAATSSAPHTSRRRAAVLVSGRP